MKSQQLRSRKKHPRGITLVAALVAAGVLGIAAMLVIQAFKHMGQSQRFLTRRLEGDETLVTTAVSVEQLDYGELLNQCRQKNILNIPQPRVGPCVVGGNKRLDPALGNPPPNTLPWATEVLRDAYGQPSPQGTYCVELLQCRHLAGGRILEVLVQGNWREDSTQRVQGGENIEGVVSRRLTFRRTRW